MAHTSFSIADRNRFLDRISPGDPIDWNGPWGLNSGTFQLQYGEQVVILADDQLWIVQRSTVCIPPAPKAIAGKVYRERGITCGIDDRCGTIDGRLFDPAGTPRYLEMSAEWIEVPKSEPEEND